jgi:acetoacetyl-CoA reductase
MTKRVAYVTGGMGGIGTSICQRLHKDGYTVVAGCGPNSPRRVKWLEEQKALGYDFIASEGNVGDWESTKNAFDKVKAEVGEVDILVNNAGITRDKTLRKMTDDDWLCVLNTNLNACYLGVTAAMPMMVEQKYGRIINISSFVGQAGNFGQANYAASKGGIIAFTKTAAMELAKHNVTCNSLAPGFTETGMLAKVPEAVQAQILARIPMGRFATPEEIARAVLFLAADGDYVTGQQINVNGGVYM